MSDARPQPSDPNDELRIKEALKARERGWLVTPTRGKSPYRKGWASEPPPDEATVRRWASAGNYAIRTGEIVVIDDDTNDGSAEQVLSLLPTVTVITGAGRKHHYFRRPATARIKNSTSKLAPNVDVRAEGGAAVGVGSRHPETGNIYAWAPGRSPDEIEMAELPAEIVAALEIRKTPKADRLAPGGELHERLCRYARKACERNAEMIARAPEGKRNEMLNRAAFVVGRFVGACILDRGYAEDALRTAGGVAGLEEREIEATIRSGLDAGIADPHDLKTLDRKASRQAEDGADIPAGPRDDARKRPIIIVEGGCLPEIVDASEQALLKDGGAQLYQREGQLVRMTRAQSCLLDDGIRRSEGALNLILVEGAYLVERLTKAASYQKFDGRSKQYVPIDCPERVAATYLARRGYWCVPALRAVIEAPTLRPDGSILQAPGYDTATHLFFDSGGVEFAPVPENPSRDDAIAALAKIHELIQGFPFLEGPDRSVALAAIVTGIIRRNIRTAPLFAFRAPKMGSGKSLLADVVSMMATGRPAPAMPQGKDEDEDRKRMLALLLEGDPVSLIDNIERPFASSALCSILTQTTFKDRILGRTGTATVPTCTTWLATGNNLIIAGDLTTRTLVCDLDAKVERPEEREFAVNLYEHIPANRTTLVPAVLTLLRAYHVAGRPKQKLSVFGRFEAWSNLVRSTLVWCGEADPNLTRQRIEIVDPVRQQIQSVLMGWSLVLGDTVVTAADAIEIASKAKVESAPLFREALVAALGGTDADLTSIKLGNWLSKHERRPEAGLRVNRMGHRQGVALWAVSRV